MGWGEADAGKLLNSNLGVGFTLKKKKQWMLNYFEIDGSVKVWDCVGDNLNWKTKYLHWNDKLLILCYYNWIIFFFSNYVVTQKYTVYPKMFYKEGEKVYISQKKTAWTLDDISNHIWSYNFTYFFNDYFETTKIFSSYIFSLK